MFLIIQALSTIGSEDFPYSLNLSIWLTFCVFIHQKWRIRFTQKKVKPTKNLIEIRKLHIQSEKEMEKKPGSSLNTFYVIWFPLKINVFFCSTQINTTIYLSIMWRKFLVFCLFCLNTYLRNVEFILFSLEFNELEKKLKLAKKKWILSVMIQYYIKCKFFFASVNFNPLVFFLFLFLSLENNILFFHLFLCSQWCMFLLFSFTFYSHFITLFYFIIVLNTKKNHESKQQQRVTAVIEMHPEWNRCWQTHSYRLMSLPLDAAIHRHVLHIPPTAVAMNSSLILNTHKK